MKPTARELELMTLAVEEHLPDYISGKTRRDLLQAIHYTGKVRRSPGDKLTLKNEERELIAAGLYNLLAHLNQLKAIAKNNNWGGVPEAYAPIQLEIRILITHFNTPTTWKPRTSKAY